MNKYRVTNKRTGGEYIYRGETCAHAAEKFKSRKVFGEFITFSMKLLQLDADTRGEKWAQYLTDRGEEIMIEVVGGVSPHEKRGQAIGGKAMTQKVEMSLKNLKENYDKNFLGFVQRIARECNPQDAQDWIYQDTETEDGEPCLWAGRYDGHGGKIEVHEYAGVTEGTNDFGNNIPTTVISIDCCQGGVGTSGREALFAELIAALTE